MLYYKINGKKRHLEKLKANLAEIIETLMYLYSNSDYIILSLCVSL